MTRDDGASCLFISAEEGHLDMVKVLDVGGRELVILGACSLSGIRCCFCCRHKRIC